MSNSEGNSFRALSTIRQKKIHRCKPIIPTSKRTSLSLRTTRAHTGSSHNIGFNLIGIMNVKGPEGIHKLLRTKGIFSPDRRENK
jgi:hypothetical protein